MWLQNAVLLNEMVKSMRARAVKKDNATEMFGQDIGLKSNPRAVEHMNHNCVTLIWTYAFYLL